MPRKADPLKGYPRVRDCKPGLWVELTSGWIVGPIVETDFPRSVYVRFADGTWMVDVRDDSRVKPPGPDATRLVKRVGTRDELLKGG